MFEELWLIHNSLCLYHKTWTENPISVDGNLFSGFLSAFKSFQEQVFPSQNIKHIDFHSDRLVFSVTSYFYIVVRDQLEKPVERSIMQLTNITSEVTTHIESDSRLYSYFSNKSQKPISLLELEESISPIIENVIFMISLAESQVNKYDVVTILHLMRELRDLILEINDDRVFFNFARSNSNAWFYELLFSDQDIDLQSVPVISYKMLHSILEDFIKQVSDSLTLYGNKKVNGSLIELHNKIISFLSMNSDTLRRFGIIDSFLTGPLRFFKFEKEKATAV